MPEEYKVVKRVELTLETPHQEVAIYLGAYINGVHDTCAWIQKVRHGSDGRVSDNLYKWVVDLKERLNTSNDSEEEIRENLKREIDKGLEYILRGVLIKAPKFDFNLQVKEVKIE